MRDDDSYLEELSKTERKVKEQERRSHVRGGLEVYRARGLRG